MKVADYIVHRLGEEGIKDIFEVYGAANGDLIDAFTRVTNTRYVSVMHEQAGGFAVEGYAKVTGNLGAAIATSCPGGQNFVTPIANCFYDSVPAIFLTGQVNSRFLRPDSRIRQIGFQECDIVSIVSPITKYARLVRNPKDIRYELEKAIYLARNGRPGPVLLDLPIDVQKAEINPESLEGFDSSSFQTSYDMSVVNEKINRFINDLSHSQRPVIIVGAGVRHAKGIDELLVLGQKLKIPLFPTWNAIDIVTSDYPYYGGRIGTYGGSGRNFGLQNSDLVLSIGSRISGRIFGSNSESFLRAARRYMVDVDESNLERKLQSIPFHENVLCDAKLFLKMLNERLGFSSFYDFSQWTSRVMEWKRKYDPVAENSSRQISPVNPYVFMRTLSEQMNEGDIIVGDCGGNIVIMSQAFKTKKGQRFLTNNGNSPMGFSFSGAMGAYLASDKKHNVVCIIGDGGFNMNIQELQTVKNYGLNFKTFILNNHCYGITRQFQRTRFEGREEACGPRGYNPPDFVKIVNAYGIPTVSINQDNEAKEKIQQVLNAESPVVCDVDCHDWDTYEPRVFGGSAIEDMDPRLPREEFESNMIIPVYQRKKAEGEA